MTYVIDDDRKWRISKSGFSIKTGWATESRIVMQYAGSMFKLDGYKFQRWLEDAERACELYNAALEPRP